MFQNVNKIGEPTWRDHQRRLFRVTGVHRGSIGAPSWVCRGSFRGQTWLRWGSDMHALQMTSPNNLSKPNNKLEKLDQIFHTRTRQELAPFIHCVIESSKNQQQPPVRALRSNYVRNFHILSENYEAIMSPKIVQTIWLKCYKGLARHHFLPYFKPEKDFCWRIDPLLPRVFLYELRLHDFWTIFGNSEHSGPFDDGLAL